MTINRQCVGEFNGRSLYTGNRLDYGHNRRIMYVIINTLRVVPCSEVKFGTVQIIEQELGQRTNLILVLLAHK